MPNEFFGQNLQKKGLKKKKVSFTTEFYMFELALVPNLSSKEQHKLLEQIYRKRVFPV